MAERFDLKFDSIRTIDPIGFLNFLQLENYAKLVLTDSGGVQEETCILGVPCITLRDNTERPETVTVGSNLIAGTNPLDILKGVKKMINSPHNWDNPFGDGRSGLQIVEILHRLLYQEKRLNDSP